MAPVGTVVVNEETIDVVPSGYMDVMVATDVVPISIVVESPAEGGASGSEAVAALAAVVASSEVSFSFGSWGSFPLWS